MEHDDRALKAAAFLAQALDLGDDPTALAEDLSLVDRDPAVAVFAAELDSSAGPAAFLVYAYALAAADPAGRTGRDRFAADLATLQRAAELDAPGPRAVAHAATTDDAFILATTPATLRALTGEAVPPAAAALAPGPAFADREETRRAAAGDLLRLLRAADDRAEVWLAVVDPDAAFLPEETELALFLLDERSIRSLLRAIDRVLTEARRRTAGERGGEPGPDRGR